MPALLNHRTAAHSCAQNDSAIDRAVEIIRALAVFYDFVDGASEWSCSPSFAKSKPHTSPLRIPSLEPRRPPDFVPYDVAYHRHNRRDVTSAGLTGVPVAGFRRIPVIPDVVTELDPPEA